MASHLEIPSKSDGLENLEFYGILQGFIRMQSLNANYHTCALRLIGLKERDDGHRAIKRSLGQRDPTKESLSDYDITLVMVSSLYTGFMV